MELHIYLPISTVKPSKSKSIRRRLYPSHSSIFCRWPHVISPSIVFIPVAPLPPDLTGKPLRLRDSKSDRKNFSVSWPNPCIVSPASFFFDWPASFFFHSCANESSPASTITTTLSLCRANQLIQEGAMAWSSKEDYKKVKKKEKSIKHGWRWLKFEMDKLAEEENLVNFFQYSNISFLT